jgi:hypothetical protein
MASDDIRAIELRRLHELEKKAALLGPNTPPEVLIEIQELHTKYPDAPRNGQRPGAADRSRAQSEIDFVMNAVAAALRRITGIEQRQTQADETRQQLDDKLDQVLFGVGELRRWGRAIAGVALLALVIALVLAVKVF